MKNLLHYSFLAVLSFLIAGPHFSIIEKGKAVGILHSRIMRNDPKTGITENTSSTYSTLTNPLALLFPTPNPLTEVAVRSSGPENPSNIKRDCSASNTMLAASKCDSIGFAVQPFNLFPGACCWRLVVENEVDSCFNQIQLTLHNNVFTNVVADVPNGWTAVGLGNQLLLTHSSGFIPAGTSYPLYWCLPATTIVDSLTVASQYVCTGVIGSCDTTLVLGCAQGYTCCEDYNAFLQNVQNAVSVTTIDSLCKAVVTVSGLPPCDSLLYIDWGDGNIDFGAFSNGMYMHTYSQSGNYTILIPVIELSAIGPCFDAGLDFPVTLHCGGNPCDTLPPECLTDSIILNTGYDHDSTNLYDPGEFDAWWTLVESPDSSLSLPRPAWVLATPAYWDDQPNDSLPCARWISAYSTPEFNTNNPDSLPPYTFERCFCVCADSSDVTIFLSAMADNVAEFTLTDSTGNPIDTLLSITTTNNASFLLPPDTSTTTVTLTGGTYCIEAHLRNLSGGSMGINLCGSVTGDGLVAEGCCHPQSAIIGYKYADTLCVGLPWMGQPGLPGWQIVLCDSNNVPLDTVVTDASGYYGFVNIPPGNYNVKEINQVGWTPKTPAGGAIGVMLDTAEVKQIDFGNCPPLDVCCLDPVVFDQNIQNAISVTSVDSLCKAVLTVSDLPPCDSIISINWGDGNTDNGPFGNGMYMHTYAQSGTYTISVIAFEYDANGDVCFENIFYFPITVTCECLCGEWKFAFNFGDLGLFFPVNCGDTLLFGCPPDSNVFLIGDFTCAEDSCLPTLVEWVLDGPNTSTTGTTTPDSISIAFTSPFHAGWYHLSLSTLCGSDTCICDITWYQEDCPVDSCCLDPVIFEQNIQNAISVTSVDSLCKAVLTVSDLPPCDSIISINWGDGNTDNGPFGNGMYMHTYVQSGTYTISVIAFEYDANGDVCFENIFYFPVTVNCECLCGDWNLSFNFAGVSNPVDCGDTLYFECPAVADAVITGSFSCLEDSCLAAPIQWEINGPNSSSSGITSPDNIFIALPSPFDAGWYQLTLNTLCGSDTCICDITWYQEDCPVDSCCLDPAIFSQNIQNALTLSTDDSLCKATLIVTGLPPCDSITSIDWGDGNMDSGPFGDGMYMHTYTQSGTYVITVEAVEYDSLGKVCFDMSLTFTIDLNCLSTATGEGESIPAPEVFPNPVSGQLYISLPVPGEWTVELWSFDGRQVLPPETLVASPDPWPLDVGSLPPGVYLVVVKNGGPNGSVWRGRVVKM